MTLYDIEDLWGPAPVPKQRAPSVTTSAKKVSFSEDSKHEPSVDVLLRQIQELEQRMTWAMVGGMLILLLVYNGNKRSCIASRNDPVPSWFE